MFFKYLKPCIYIFIIFILFLTNCGYQLTNYDKTLLGTKKISIGHVNNKTNNPSLKGLIINELAHQLNLKYDLIFTPKFESNLILNCNILSITTYKIPLQFSNNKKYNNEKIECLSLTIEIIIENKNGDSIWYIDKISEVSYYIINSYKKIENENIREKAIKNLIKKICGSILLNILHDNQK